MGSYLWRFEWQHPLLLLLIIPFVAGWWWAKRSHHIKKVHGHLAPLSLEVTGRRQFAAAIRNKTPMFLRALVMLLLIMALVDVTRTYEWAEDKAETHRIFLIWDSSSSTWGFTQTRFASITCSTTGKFFPRIHGICRAAYRVIDEVERFGAAKEQGAQDLVALVQFADHSFVISYPTNDYTSFRRRIDDMELYSWNILGRNTEMHLAIWDSYLMAFERNMDKKSGFTYMNGQDIRSIAVALAPGKDSASRFTLPNDLREKLERIREEFRDTVFIIFTDAVVSYLTPRVETASPYSIRREMQLAEFLQVPFFYLSTDEFYPELKRLARRTGSGAPDSGGRGDFLMVKKDGDYAQMSELVSAILKARFSQKKTIHTLRRESYAEWCVAASLFFFVMSIWWKKSFARSLTDAE